MKANKLFLLASLLLSGSMIPITAQNKKEKKQQRETTKVGHTGCQRIQTGEQLWKAFELAIRQGADGIELDVHTSADGELIVMHDENVDVSQTEPD